MKKRLKILTLILIAILAFSGLALTASGATPAPSASQAGRFTDARPEVIVYNSLKGGDIRWTAIPGAYGYRIYRHRPADGGNKLIATLYSHLQYYDQ